MTTRLTIGICTFNRGPEIRDTLASLCAMENPGGRVERIVVVDNNCTDDTPGIVDAFAAGSPAIPVVRVVEKRQGLAQARRRLIEESTTELVAFLDDDVIADKRWAASVLDLMDRKPRAGVVGGKVRLVFQAGPTRLATRFSSFLARQELGDAELLVDDPTRALVGAALCLRRQAIIESGWMDTQVMPDRQGTMLTSGGDNELCIRIRQRGWETWYQPGAAVDHLIPARRQTREYLARLAAGIGLSIPFVKLLANPKPTEAWAESNLRQAQTRRARTLLLEWRRDLRPIRLAEHEGRVEGWRQVCERLSSV